MANYRRPLAIFGPTASGKTALAIALARTFDGVVINADALQVYADLPTLTARPSAQEVAQAPHELFGFLAADAKMDVACWLDLATATARAVQATGKLPIFCGGTGFYLKALAEGLSPIPAARVEAAEARLAALGIEAFEAEVFAHDPDLRGTFAAGDVQRLLRAWAVFTQSGTPLSVWQAAPKVGGLGALATFALLPDRAALYDKINRRFSMMIAQGAIAEVQTSPLMSDPTLPLAQAIGAREVLALLAGQMREGEVIATASQATRNYAKRQLTWVRNQALTAVKLPMKALDAAEIAAIAHLVTRYLA